MSFNLPTLILIYYSNSKTIVNENSNDVSDINETDADSDLLTSRIGGEAKLKLLSLKLKVAHDERLKLISEISDMVLYYMHLNF